MRVLTAKWCKNHLLLLAIPNPPSLVVIAFLWGSKLGSLSHSSKQPEGGDDSKVV